MNFIKTWLNIISLLFYCISLYYLFVQVQSVHGSFYYYAYGYSVCWFLAAFVLCIFSNTTFSKIIVGLYLSTLLLVSVVFMYRYLVVDFRENAFNVFFNSLLLGACNWFVAMMLPIQFGGVSVKKKAVIVIGIFIAGICTYAIFRYLPIVWHIFRSEVGTHIIWLVLGNIMVLGCTFFYYKKVHLFTKTISHIMP